MRASPIRRNREEGKTEKKRKQRKKRDNKEIKTCAREGKTMYAIGHVRAERKF